MPIQELSGGNAWGEGLGAALGYLAQNPQRQAAKQQREYQSQEQKMRGQQLALQVQEQTQKSKEYESQTAQDALNASLIHGLTNAPEKGGIGPPPTDGDPMKLAAYNNAAIFHLVNSGYNDSKILSTLKQEGQLLNTQAITPARIESIKAGTGLTGAKTVTEQQRPELVKAQTANTAAMPQDREAALRVKILEGQQRVQMAAENRDAALQRAQMSQSAAEQRAAMSQAAAYDRMMYHEQSANQRFERTEADKAQGRTEHKREFGVTHPAGWKPPAARNQPDPKIGHLAAPIQSVIIKLRKQGVTDDGIRQMVTSSTAMDPATKQATLQALGAPAAPAAEPPGPNPLQAIGDWFRKL